MNGTPPRFWLILGLTYLTFAVMIAVQGRWGWAAVFICLCIWAGVLYVKAHRRSVR